MKVPVLVSLVITAFVLGPGCSQGASEDAPKLRGKLDLVKERLRGLADCGITLARGTPLDELLPSLDEGEPAARQYLGLITAMGQQVDRDPHPFRSDSVFTLELDSIEKRGDYAFLVRRLRALARGKLPMTKIEDYLNLTKKKAWVAFTLGKRRYKWEARVKGTRIDHEVLVKFADLLKRKNAEVRFTFLRLGGGFAVIGCATNKEMRCLKDLGVAVTWLQ